MLILRDYNIPVGFNGLMGGWRTVVTRLPAISLNQIFQDSIITHRYILRFTRGTKAINQDLVPVIRLSKMNILINMERKTTNIIGYCGQDLNLVSWYRWVLCKYSATIKAARSVKII